MFQGELIAALVTDNGPTRLPYFNETCAAMPSQRHKDEVAALIAGAHACCRAANLHTGVYNVEMIYTSQGPRLIEINARLGGVFILILRCLYLLIYLLLSFSFISRIGPSVFLMSI
jgi:carnosine synthase